MKPSTVSAAASTTGANVAMPILAAIGGIATFSAMDAAMKGASIALGVFTALFLRNAIGTAMALPLWMALGRRRPPLAAIRLHALRSGISVTMASLFFYGLVRMPIAEAIALSFISPIIALYFASLLLGEKIRANALMASLFGIGGVVVITAGRFGNFDLSGETLNGTLAVLASAVFYAVNLVLQRQQALMAGPYEVALFQSLFATLFLALPASFVFVAPSVFDLAIVALAAVLATAALLLLAWGYARAETQVLLPVEYTGFLWAALLGWLFFDERLTTATVAGTALIVAGCWIGARQKSGAPVGPPRDPAMVQAEFDRPAP